MNNFWVRTQGDGAIWRVHNFFIDEEANGIYGIKSFVFSERLVVLGRYPSEVRAKEVFNMMCEHKRRVERATFMTMQEARFVDPTFIMPSS